MERGPESEVRHSAERPRCRVITTTGYQTRGELPGLPFHVCHIPVRIRTRWPVEFLGSLALPRRSLAILAAILFLSLPAFACSSIQTDEERTYIVESVQLRDAHEADSESIALLGQRLVDDLIAGRMPARKQLEEVSDLVDRIDARIAELSALPAPELLEEVHNRTLDVFIADAQLIVETRDLFLLLLTGAIPTERDIDRLADLQDAAVRAWAELIQAIARYNERGE